MSEAKQTTKFVKKFDKDLIQQEPAEKIFNDLLEYYDIDFNDIEIDQGEEGALTVKNKLVRALRRGRMETNIHEDAKKGFQIIHHLRDGTSITYNEYNHTCMEESVKCKGVKNIAMMGALCDEGLGRLKQLRGPDLKLIEFISVLFSL